MRRGAALVLFAILAVPMLLPLCAFRSPKPETQLPACCRRDGKHHCSMLAGMEKQSDEHAFGQAPVTCPYRSATATVAPASALYAPVGAMFYAAAIEHPSVHPQVAINLLVAEARSHQKRGPPSLAL